MHPVGQEYINEHYEDESLNRETVSAAVGLTPSYFGREFKKETGIHFSEYLMNFRIEKAKSLLLNSRKSVSEITFEVGFNSQSYFGYVFRKATGLPRNISATGPVPEVPIHECFFFIQIPSKMTFFLLSFDSVRSARGVYLWSCRAMNEPLIPPRFEEVIEQGKTRHTPIFSSFFGMRFHRRGALERNHEKDHVHHPAFELVGVHRDGGVIQPVAT